MYRFVLDTSIFTNPDVASQFGEDEAAVGGFLDLARKVPADFFMPLSVYEELRKMRDLDPLIGYFESVVRIRSPRRSDLQIPGDFLYDFIDEVRKRIDHGLRIAEEHAKLAGAAAEMGQLLHQLRERYREALRRGILDSRGDVDVVLLAFEIDGSLVAADHGLRKWADRIGVAVVDARHFRDLLRHLVETKGAAEGVVEKSGG
ncbi:conserved protein of unknown function [Methylacidimicrobium sp. AP8]|uniref:RNA ligase partner protein n=1 Tax=Methylacidimicrobium sp. AP8 TaxID=2730359 RepID=UPI0018C0F55B|nr:RNA ligase partner protein [Methylacidimicrobium sp. AP8]CAB4242396.1 conserved protein of unknown function [Methylacidimicrobium sp. AP8]